MMIPLITNKNKPKLKTVKGIVKNTKMGLIKKLRKPKTTATVRAVMKEFTTIPLKK